MCGVTAILLSNLDPKSLRALCLSRSKIIRHRGPDWSGIRIVSCGNDRYHALAHERLSIVDPLSGKQPLSDPDGLVVASVNGEIYNFRELLETKLDPDHVKRMGSRSDCQVIPSLYALYGQSFVSMLDGDFALVAVRTDTGEFIAARDPIGICPLYMGYAADGSIRFSSEIKGLQQDCVRVREFPPGHYFHFTFSNGRGELIRFFNPIWMSPDGGYFKSPFDPQGLRYALEQAVAKRLMCDVPFGLMLYGGLDSAIIASIATRLYKDRKAAKEAMWTPTVHSFSIGVKGGADLAFARSVAEHCGCTHHEFTFEPQEAIDALSDVIYAIESYDVGTVRASTLNYFIFRLIKSMGIKMVLTGEGANELFTILQYPNNVGMQSSTRKSLLNDNKSTEYFDSPRHSNLNGGGKNLVSSTNVYDQHQKNNASLVDGEANQWGDHASDKSSLADMQSILQQNIVASVINIHHSDSLRANKASMAWGVEARVPYLDTEFIEFAMRIDPRDKLVDENKSLPKQLLRDAFAEDLPECILKRARVDCVDGVSNEWIEGLREYAEAHVSDMMMLNAEILFPYNTPTTKEAYLYRSIFSEHFPDKSAAKTIPDNCINDVSVLTSGDFSCGQ